MDLFSSVFSSPDTNLFYSIAQSGSFKVFTIGKPPNQRLTVTSFRAVTVHYVTCNCFLGVCLQNDTDPKEEGLLLGYFPS